MMWLAFLALMLADVRAIDADTLRARGETYRLAGVDAPETARARCPGERALAWAAQARAQALLDAAAAISASPAFNPAGRRVWPRDRYGRRLAHILVDGRDLGATLIAEGHAVAWTPGGQHDWCAESARRTMP